MILIKAARRVNRYIKKMNKEQSGKYLSIVRRIERTAPLNDKKVVAVTFDDGPSAVIPEPNRVNTNKLLTEALLDVLKEYNAKGTFDIIGTTEYNYPDIQGKLNTPSWGGIKHDHYPDYGNDKLGGAVNNKAAIQRIINENHELSSHTYKHVLFGPMRMVYGKRSCFHSLEEVVWDLSQLHKFIKDNFNYDMKFSRPPHYIDRITGGYNSYDAYAVMGYNYLAASFDGGGWKPSSGDYNIDVHDMVAPLQKSLYLDPDSLNGQIIFHKDGYNMSHQTPVVDALPKHLKLLKEHGYNIVTVSELIAMSPYEDVMQNDPIFDIAKALEKTGYCVGYKNNTFQPDRYMTRGELAMMITPPDIIRKLYCTASNLAGYYDDIDIECLSYYKDVSRKHPYYTGISYSGNLIVPKGTSYFNPDKYITKREFESFLNRAAKGINLRWLSNSDKQIKRREAAEVLLSYISQTQRKI